MRSSPFWPRTAGYPKLLHCLEGIRTAVKREVEIERASIVGLSSLRIPEMVAGKRSQLHMIERMCRRLERHHRDLLQHNEGSKNQPFRIFDQLRDCYSLNPADSGFLGAFRSLAMDLSGACLAQFQELITGKHVVAHVSCDPKARAAHESLASFLPFQAQEVHLVVTGNPQARRFSHCSPGMVLRGQRLQIDAADNYEGHCCKVMLLYTLLHLFGPPKGVFKLDDDIHLLNRYRFNKAIADIMKANTDYAGYAIKPNASTFNHGWHIGKCEERRFDSFGHQYPFPQVYAKGGDGYYLSAAGLALLAKDFLAKRRFYASVPMLEDVAVGLAAFLGKISLEERDFAGSKAKEVEKPIFCSSSLKEAGYDHIRRLSRSSLRNKAQETALFRKRSSTLLGSRMKRDGA